MRAVIAEFLQQRLDAKLEKLEKLEKPDEDDAKRNELRTQFIPAHWLGDAARRVSQIQAVTHSLKPIHPDAKGSSLFCDPAALSPRTALGSHVLGTAFEADVVGNAAALDVYKFLKLEHLGRSVLSLASQADADLGAALSDDSAVAAVWMAAFASLAAVRGKPSSHTQAKQLYWLVGGNPHDDDQYHLLAPLYPTSLVHKVYQTLQNDRFGDDIKAAREARKASTWHGRPVREYPQLAIQKLGGNNTQNISQLNSERRGDNCLLASLPPMWQSADVQPLWGADSLFKALRWRPGVRSLLKRLQSFLSSDPTRNRGTRASRDELVEDLLDELLQFATGLQALAPGWTADHRCELPRSYMAWLDPQGDTTSPGDLMDLLASDFARWLNHELRASLLLGDDEYQHWRTQARELFKVWEREGLYDFA
jgi:CRISPR-associated protein Csy1